MKCFDKALVPSVVLAFMTPGFTLSAADFTWIPGSTDWRSPSSYKDANGVTPVSVLPGAGDVVVFQGTQTVSVGDDDIAFVSSIGRLSLGSNDVTLEFDLDDDARLDADIVKGEGAGNVGKLVKKGAGALQLGDAVIAGGGTVSNYKLHTVVVDEGTLISPTNIPSYNHFAGHILTVNANGTFIVPSPGNFRFDNVFGTGTISNLAGRAGVIQFQPMQGGSEFGGKLIGTFTYFSRAGIDLTGTESTIDNGFKIYGLNAARTLGSVGVMKLGVKGQPSSVGLNAVIGLGTGDGSAALRYLGQGEWTDRQILLGATKGEPIVVDAGEYGGVYFTDFGAMGWAGMIPLVLDGANAKPCVISNSITCKVSGGTNYTVQITKKGPGAWRFTNSGNEMAGAIIVENGTLQFDSLAERGQVCALGTATELYKPVFGKAKDENAVDYAYLLGSASTRGMLEYLGEKAVVCTNRPVRLKGTGGGFAANGGSLRIGDFASADTAGSTLVLSGGNATANFALDVTDGAGPLSVVKEGSGTWVLGRRQDFSGSLSVRQGTLVARNNKGQRYSWYRIWFKEKGSTSTLYPELEDGPYIQVMEFALKNADGVQQNICMNEKTVWSDLAPGECARGETDGYIQNSDLALLRMFDGDDSTWAQIGSEAKGFLLGDPESWFPVVLRLPEEADEVVSFDMMYQQPNEGNIYAGRNPTAFSIEASVDGVVWEEVGGLTDIPILEIPNKVWLTKSTPYENSQALFALSGAVQKFDDTVLTGVGEVFVASGATLRFEGVDNPVSELRLAADGNGTFENVVFAASGTVTVNRFEKGRVTVIPAVFLNCTTLGNLAGWELRCPGKNLSAYRLRVGRDGSLRIVPPGFSVVLK